VKNTGHEVYYYAIFSTICLFIGLPKDLPQVHCLYSVE